MVIELRGREGEGYSQIELIKKEKRKERPGLIMQGRETKAFERKGVS